MAGEDSPMSLKPFQPGLARIPRCWAHVGSRGPAHPKRAPDRKSHGDRYRIWEETNRALMWAFPHPATRKSRNVVTRAHRDTPQPTNDSL